ncbi:hypothetical protein AB8810_00405 [Xanthomonas sp. NCPPB 3005]|jgi:hypothetical protein|uniref:hypothetical protein n=1 Tax=Xanthomonas sp. NCPPB 3005 TaxID=3240913 RepID=UPI003514CF52
MSDTFTQIVKHAIDPSSVRTEGPLTQPRSYGVYQLPYGAADSGRFRFGNHPVRMQELEREFGSCVLTFLFAVRDDAEAVARALNGREV